MPGVAQTDEVIAVVDGGSFILPYDHGLVGGLVRQGRRVTVFASRTRYNAEFLDDLRAMSGVTVIDRAVSGSVSSRLQGVRAYAGLLRALWQQRHHFSTINLQFSVLWPLELPFWWLLRRQLVYTVHNAVPHGHLGLQHAPTRWIAMLARQLVFVSAATLDDFLRRYGEGFRAKTSVLPHGLLPLLPRDAVQPVRLCAQPQALVFWGTVKGYKGIELFAALARSADWKLHGLPLEIHGRWDTELHPMRDELITLGVLVEDRYLDAAAMRALMAREVLFVLPYRDASQSGALYTLLHQGCTFACSDAGDLGAFLRRFKLQGLLLPERSAGAVLDAVQHLRQHATAVAQALQDAQQRSTWDTALADADSVYGPVPRA